MLNEQDSRIPNSPSPQTNSSRRWLMAATMCLLAAAYTVGVVLGIIPKDQKIDVANLIVLAVAGVCAILLINPEILERLRHLKLASFEFDLEKLKEKQEQQQGQLEAIHLLLPLVLQEQEAKHLLNLAENNTAGYVGSHDVRTELRRLKAMRLIEKFPGRFVGDLKDGLNVDLAKCVYLTSFGRRMVAQLEEMAKAKSDEAP